MPRPRVARRLAAKTLALACVAFMSTPCRAFEVVLDYTLDEQNWNWFAGSPAGVQRRAALDAAAGFLSAILTDDDWSAATIDSSTFQVSDVFQATINGLDGQPLSGTPESDGAGYYYNVPITNRSSVAANEFVVYVAPFAFDSGTSAHAKAGPNGTTPRTFAAEFGDEFTTWGADLQFDLSESWYTGLNPGFDPTDDYGVQDPNKAPPRDLTTDNWVYSTSSDSWKGFDLERADPAADGKLDLYATALHELLHALGVTTANLSQYIGFDGQGRLIGENLVAAYGGPVPASGGHVAEDLQSVVWGSGDIVSEALLDPNARRGVRKYLTEVDAALLSDLGYEVADAFLVDPLAGDYNDDGVVDAADYTVWRDTQGSALDHRGDGDGDGAVGADDYALWASLYGNGSGPAAANAAPEPASGTLVGMTLALAFARDRRRREAGNSSTDCRGCA